VFVATKPFIKKIKRESGRVRDLPERSPRKESKPMLKPLGDRVVVKTLEAETVSAGGIYLPATAQEKPQQAEVIAVGPGKTLDNGNLVPVEIKVGDKVVYGKYSGTEIKVDGEDVVVLRQDDILGIVEG